jgi:hypothetical protein
MNWVCPAARTVLQLPDLNGASRNISKHTVLNVSKSDIVDKPLSVAAVESEMVVDSRTMRGERHLAQSGGHNGCVRLSQGARPNHESHHLIGVQVVIISTKVSNIFEVAKVNALSLVRRKVEDNFPTLSHRCILKSH